MCYNGSITLLTSIVLVLCASQTKLEEFLNFELAFLREI